MKTIKALILAAMAVCICACNSGSTPTETSSSAGPKNTEQKTMEQGIRNNPNMPDAAKNAILGGK